MAVVATGEKQTLTEELVKARALIEAGRYEAALDRLEKAREQAQARAEGQALGEIRALARAIWLRAPRGSRTTDRADRLVLAVSTDSTLPVASPVRPPRMFRRRLVLWSAGVVVAWLAVSIAVGTTAKEGWLFSRGDLILFALIGFGVIALGVWLVGVLVLLGFRDRWGRAVAHWVGVRARGRTRLGPRRKRGVLHWVVPRARGRTKWVVAGVGALGLVAAGVVVLISSGGSGFPSGAGGGRIVFERRDGHGVFRLYVMNADGSQQQSLTPKSVDASSPAWSPDGEQVAFVTGQEIWVMRKDGSEKRRLTSGPDGHPAWSPDGRTIAFERGSGVSDLTGPSSIYLIAAEGSHERALTHPGTTWDTTPHWSPDGQMIVFARGTDRPRSLYLIKTDGTGLRRLTATGLDSLPAWSPDGRTIAFVRDDVSGNRRIMFIDPDGTHLRFLTPADADATEPSWSPDGTTIAFTVLTPRCDDIGACMLGFHSSYEWAIHTMHSNGTNDRELTQGADATAPAWQPAPQPST